MPRKTWVPTLATTPMRRKYFQGLAKGLKPSAAAQAAGSRDPEDYPAGVRRDPSAKAYLTKALNRAGATDTKTARTIAEALDANKTISAVILQGKQSTDVEPTDADGKTTDFIDVPDWSNRLKAAELVCKLKDQVPRDVPPGPASIVIVYGHRTAPVVAIRPPS